MEAEAEETPKRRRCPVRGALHVRVREAEMEMWQENLEHYREQIARGEKPSGPGTVRGPARRRYLYLLNEYLQHLNKHGC
jgi:hypothetical protein